MRRLKKRIILIGTLVVAIALFAGFEQHYVMTRLDTHQRRMEGFYLEESDSLDMIVMGSSEVYNGFVPARAWEEYRITNYIYGFKSNPDSLWSYQLKEIERTQSPDVLVIECNGAIYDAQYLEDPAEMRFMTDDMPLSQNKIRLIRERGTDEKLSYYFPLIKYHVHLIPDEETLSKALLEKRGFHILRGNQARIDGHDVSGAALDVEGDDSVAALRPEAEEYLRDFLVQCQDSDIKNIVFVRFPHVVTEDNYYRFQRYHRIGEIVEEYGFDYIDLDDYREEMGLNVKDDFVDSEHLNANGAQKLTSFVVPFLMEKYHMQPRNQSEKVIRQWQESVDYYHRMYRYWQYFEKNYPEYTSDEYDLTDSIYSEKVIDAYDTGLTFDPAERHVSLWGGML